jgi:hypothetical protein
MSFFKHESTAIIANKEDPQEVVFYCESRLRAISNAYEHAEGEKADWIETGIRSELVSTSTFFT